MVRWEVWGREREGEGEDAAVGVVGVQEGGERWDGEIKRVCKGGGWITVIVMEWVRCFLYEARKAMSATVVSQQDHPAGKANGGSRRDIYSTLHQSNYKTPPCSTSKGQMKK